MGTSVVVGSSWNGVGTSGSRTRGVLADGAVERAAAVGPAVSVERVRSHRAVCLRDETEALLPMTPLHMRWLVWARVAFTTTLAAKILTASHPTVPVTAAWHREGVLDQTRPAENQQVAAAT
jgi:hypothetical protein